MPELADVFRRFAGNYLLAHDALILPSHRRVIADIMACRTEALGGDLWRCTECGAEVPVFHSCRNRHCPKCHGVQTKAWLEQRQAEMLPVPYFHVTITVPEELRAALRRRQRDGYGTLMRTGAQAIIDLAADPNWVGGTVGVLTVLHTWSQQLHHHPHIHCLVTGGGLSRDGLTWRPAADGFLFPTRALAKLVRGRFRDAFTKLCPDADLPRGTWKKSWVVHITPWGSGETAVVEYLARYAFRIAITNRRIQGIGEDTVSFRYKDREAGRHRTCTVSGHEFMRRFLQHVLPEGFHKIRYHGLWHSSRRAHLANLRNVLMLSCPSPQPERAPEPPQFDTPATAQSDEPGIADDAPPLCPHCRQRSLVLLRRQSPARPRGP